MGKKITEFQKLTSVGNADALLFELGIDGEYGYILLSDFASSPGVGDMEQSVYDPTGQQSDAFDMDSMLEGTNLILTAAERAAIIANSAKTSNVTHTGHASGDTALTLQAAAITDWAVGTPVPGDNLLFESGGSLKQFDAAELNTSNENARLRAVASGFWTAAGQI